MRIDHRLTRRAALKGGAAAALAGMAGCSDRGEPPPTSTPGTERRSPRTPPSPIRAYTDQFERIVDLAEKGADTDGERPVTDLVYDEADDDTLLYLPSGRYHLDEAFTFKEFTNFGIVGDDATLVPPDGFDDNLLEIGEPGGAEAFVFDGITFDFRAEETGGRPLLVKVDDGLVVRDVTVVGPQDVDAEVMRFDVSAPSGSGYVERLRLPDGSTVGMESTGCYVGETNRGDLTFRDCHIAGFPDNGLYAEQPEGRIRVIGGLYENNNVANVRVGGEGLIRGVHVRCDEAPEDFGNMRGIRLREGDGTIIENCLVEMIDVTASDGAITLSNEMNSATIRNTRIRIDTENVAAILGKIPSRFDGGQSLRCENVTIEGSAADASAIQVLQRDGCVFDGLTIDQTGENRDGITLIDSIDNVVRDSQIDVTAEPLVLHDAEATTDNVWANEEMISLP